MTIIKNEQQNISEYPTQKEVGDSIKKNMDNNVTLDSFLTNQSKNIEKNQISNVPEKNIPFPHPKNSKFVFIDLFSGIGGFRIAFQNLGGKCIFSSELDKYAQETYVSNFGEKPFGDITQINEKDIPDHDVLCAGFPCQAFSIAGRRGGFEDTRGTLFFDVARIIKEKKPKAFFRKRERAKES